MGNALQTPIEQRRSRTFVLYVEGPRDRDVLRAWAQRVGRGFGRALSRSAVILGGRQPERASEHFARVLAVDAEARGICVLDRDGDLHADPLPSGHPDLEFFVWGRRHIESYLLVPDAIRRSLRLPSSDRRIARACRRVLPDPGDENAFRSLDAKRLLAREGEIARSVGLPLRAGRIAGAMSTEELHADVHALFERVRETART